jgi:hypothetical protein
MAPRLQRLGCISLVCLGWSILPTVSPADAAEKQTILLRVTDQATGNPVEGVAVGLRTEKGKANAQTDARGQCSLEIPDSASTYCWVSAKKDGFVPVNLEWTSRTGEKPRVPSEVALPLERGTTIGGLIRDDRGNPIAGATVFVLVPSNDPREPGKPRVNLWDYEAKTDAEGRWHCDIVPAKLDDV